MRDLRERGFLGDRETPAKVKAPFPEDMPLEMIPHYLRGFFDGHCSGYFRDGKPVIRINYESEQFLERLSEEVSKLTSIPLRKIQSVKGTKGHYIKYTGFTQARKLYELLYCSAPVGNLRVVKSLFKMREMAGGDNENPKIDWDIELKTLYLVHEICCKNEVEPEKFLDVCFGGFLKFCEERNIIPTDKAELSIRAKDFVTNFKITNESSVIDQMLKKQIDAYDLKHRK